MAAHVTRRGVLLGLTGAAGASALGAVGKESGWFSGASAEPRATVKRWRAQRGEQYLVAHRGSGDVLPEHSLPAYRAARDWGAGAMEVSVAVTSDGVLVCMHDLWYDRTTNRRGKIAKLPSSVLSDVRIVQPQLGPAWASGQLPVVPRLDEVLAEFGGSLVLCLEAKDDAAYLPMMDMVEKRGLRETVLVKAYRTSGRIDQAQASGYPLFAYLGVDDLAPDAVAEFAARLHPDRDHLGLPSTGKDGGPLSDAVVRDAVGHGVPVWVYPVHRRSEAARFHGLGAAGVVCSSYGYVAGRLAPDGQDTWASKRIAAGQMTQHPDQPALAPTWTGRDELTLDRGDVQFLTLGQLSPVPTSGGTYAVQVQARWPQAPADPSSEVSVVVGHLDDRHYEPGADAGVGYEAALRADGRLEVRVHTAGADAVLATAATPPPQPGQWVPLRLAVTPTTLTLSRTDAVGSSAVARDDRVRGGYVHLGRVRAPASFRALSFA